MSDAPKKRPWFQFHLSTAVVMMFLASGLLWANLPHTIKGDTRAGWPLVFWQEVRLSVEGHFIHNYPKSVPTTGEAVNFPNPWLSTGDVCLAVATDAAVALGLLFTLAFLCEWLIRCKERRHE